MKLDDEAKKKGLIASSAGNHAQGVAYAAKKLGVKATICMPAHTPLIKVDATKAHGADVVLYGEAYDEAYEKAVELQKSEGYTFVHPFDDEDVMEGQGTIALEIMEELPDVDYILVPIGGGGLISGIACAAKQINPSVKIVGVEPEGAASALAAVEDDQLVKLSEVSTIADGTAVKQIGETPFEYIKKYDKEYKLTLPKQKMFDKPGTYTVTYKLSNKVKSVSKHLMIDVYDDVSPVIVLKESAVTVDNGSKLNLKDYIESATDKVDGDLKEKVKYNSIDTNKAGNYTVNYEVDDSAGNHGTCSMSVSVKEKPVEQPTPSTSSSNNASKNNGSSSNNASSSSCLLYTSPSPRD